MLIVMAFDDPATVPPESAWGTEGKLALADALSSLHGTHMLDGPG